MLLLKVQSDRIECGTDEAGRGCLAGPVTAAAVVLPDDFTHPFLTDSKQLSEKKRWILYDIIKKEAISYAYSHVSREEIDQLNILNASIVGMHRAIAALDHRPQFIAVDGNRFKPYPNIPSETIIRGDGKYLHIAAASIIAKTERDLLMQDLHKRFPKYQWDRNKGYPTAAHREAIKAYGATPYHRRSFKLLPNQLELDLSK